MPQIFHLQYIVCFIFLMLYFVEEFYCTHSNLYVSFPILLYSVMFLQSFLVSKLFFKLHYTFSQYFNGFFLMLKNFLIYQFRMHLYCVLNFHIYLGQKKKKKKQGRAIITVQSRVASLLLLENLMAQIEIQVLLSVKLPLLVQTTKINFAVKLPFPVITE